MISFDKYAQINEYKHKEAPQVNGSFIRLVRKSFSLWMVAERLSHLFPVGNGNKQAHYREYNHQCLICIHMIPPLSQNTETEEETLLKRRGDASEADFKNPFREAIVHRTAVPEYKFLMSGIPDRKDTRSSPHTGLYISIRI